EHFPHIKVIAVDTSGSVIFGGKPKTRHIPGMGSSITPEILKDALIDDVLHVEEEDIVKGCMDLLRHFGLFVGGSSGAVFHAARQYFGSGLGVHATRAPDAYPQSYHSASAAKPNALLLSADRGERYSTTIYDHGWLDRTFPRLAAENPAGIQLAV